MDKDKGTHAAEEAVLKLMENKMNEARILYVYG